MSFVVLVQSVGFVLGPLIAGVLSDPKLLAFFNIGIPFFAAGLFSLIAFFWIHFCFKETFISGQGKIRLLRIVTVFIEAMQHPAIRLLTFAFILHQLGIGYFMQLILIYLQQNFQYTSLGMGLFNAFMGIWFALGLLTIPYLSKRYKIEWVACISIGFIGVFVLLLTFAKVEWFVWLITVPLATVLMVAWSAILTSFSQAVDENSQGWALGITGAVVAFSFMLSGFSTDLIPNFGVMRLMIFGGILLLLSAFIMSYYCRHYLAQQPHQ